MINDSMISKILENKMAQRKNVEFKNRHNDWMWDDGELADSEYGIEFMKLLHNTCGK